MWQTLTIINPGELKSTFMHSFMREANFQALLSDDSEMCSHVSDLVEVYEAFQTEDVHKIHLAHMVDAAHVTQPQPDPAYDETHLHESKLPNSALASFTQFLNCKYNVTTGSSNPSSNLNSLAHTIISLEASFLDSFSLQGVQYLTKNYRMHNSHILFWSIQGDASMAPGHSMPSQITHIFLHSLPPSLHSCTTQGRMKLLMSHNLMYLWARPSAPFHFNHCFLLRDLWYVLTRYHMMGHLNPCPHASVKYIKQSYPIHPPGLLAVGSKL